MFCMCVNVLPECIISGACGSQKRLWVPLKLDGSEELGVVASHHVGAKNQTLVL